MKDLHALKVMKNVSNVWTQTINFCPNVYCFANNQKIEKLVVIARQSLLSVQQHQNDSLQQLLRGLTSSALILGPLKSMVVIRLFSLALHESKTYWNNCTGLENVKQFLCINFRFSMHRNLLGYMQRQRKEFPHLPKQVCICGSCVQWK